MPRSVNNWPNAITNGVFPLPPTEIFPMLTTGRTSFFTGKTRRSYKAFRIATPAPKTMERGFIVRAPAASAAEPTHPGSDGWPRHAWQINLWPNDPSVGVLLNGSATKETAGPQFQRTRP